MAHPDQVPPAPADFYFHRTVTPTSANLSERVNCCISVEDISVSLSAAPTPGVLTSYWDELRVVVVRDGVTQRTRWLSPETATTTTTTTTATTTSSTSSDGLGAVPSEKDDDARCESSQALSLLSMVDVQWSSINTAVFNVNFRRVPDRDVDHSHYPGHQPAVCSVNAKYFDAYNLDHADRARSKVLPKKKHLFLFTVECRRKTWDPTHLQEGEERLSSAGVDAVLAYCTRSKSKISSFFKKASSKFATDSTQERDSCERSVEHQQEREHHETTTDSFAVYVCSTGGVDPSEAYNAPGGKRRFSLSLYSSSNIPPHARCLPLVLNFSMRAHLHGPPLSPLRDYHDVVILVDQVIINLMGAQSSHVTKSGILPKTVESYAFGFTSNTAYTNELNFRSPFLISPPTYEEEEGGVCLLDFSSLHPSQDEHLLTASDMAKNPTSICIISSGCKNGSAKRVGSRAISVSRFKTSRDGLCKSSYKSQLVMALIRRYDTGEVEVERSANPIDLASIINQEYHCDGIQMLEFSMGECMGFRIRRRCFKYAERYRSTLLMPYDYDNSGVNCDDLDNDGDAVLFISERVSKVLCGDTGHSPKDVDKPHQDNQNNMRTTSNTDCFGVSDVVSSGCAFGDVITTSTSVKGEKGAPPQRLTDELLLSYNNYENNGYEPSERPTLATSDVIEEQRKNLNPHSQGNTGCEVNAKAASSTTAAAAAAFVGVKGAWSPFEAEGNPFETERKFFEIERKSFETEGNPFEAERNSFEEERNPFEAERNPFFTSLNVPWLVVNDHANREGGSENCVNSENMSDFFWADTDNEVVTGNAGPAVLLTPCEFHENSNEQAEHQHQQERTHEITTLGDGISFIPDTETGTFKIEY